MNRRQRNLTRMPPAWVVGAGVVCLAGGYALLRYVPEGGNLAAPPYAATGGAIFCLGLFLLIGGVIAWLRQPPRKPARREMEELPEPGLEDIDTTEPDLEPCPYCRSPIHDDTPRCPECGNYISREDAPSNTPTWIIVGGVICLIIALIWALGRG